MHHSAVQRQGARPVDQHRWGGYDVPLQGLFCSGAVRRLRDAHLRLHDRGRDPVSAADGVETGWRIVQPFLDAWRNACAEGLAFTQAGTPGPAEAERLIIQNGRAWRSLTEGC